MKIRLLLLLAVVVVPSIHAEEQLRLDMAVAGSARLEGAVQVQVLVGGFSMVEEASGSWFSLEGTMHGHYEVWDVPSIYRRSDPSSPAGPGDDEIRLTGRLVEEGPVAGQMHLGPRLQSEAVVLLKPSTPTVVSVTEAQAAVDLGKHKDPIEATRDSPVLASLPRETLHAHLPASGAPWRGTDLDVIDGDWHVLVHGTKVRIGDRTFHTGQQEGTAVGDPGTLARAGTQHDRVLLLNGTLSNVTWQSSKEDLLAPVVRGINGSVDGSFRFVDVQGSWTTNDTIRPDQLLALEAGGRFHVTATFARPESRWKIHGTADYVVLDGQRSDLLDSQTIGSAVAGAIGVGIIGWAIWAAYHRLSPDRVLEHPARQKIVELAKRRPGLAVSSLPEHLPGMSRGALRNHLDKLERVAAIQILPPDAPRSAPKYLALNSGAVMFPLGEFLLDPGAAKASAALHAWQAFQALENPRLQPCIAAFRQLGTAGYREVAQHLRERGLHVPSQGSTWSRITRALVDSGLIKPGSKGGMRQYRWNLDVEALYAHHERVAGLQD